MSSQPLNLTRFVCPACHVTVEVPPVAGRAFYSCIDCGYPIPLPPAPSEAITALDGAIAIPVRTPDGTDAKTEWDMFLGREWVCAELFNLKNAALPDLHKSKALPLPVDLPVKVNEIGRPLATLKIEPSPTLGRRLWKWFVTILYILFGSTTLFGLIASVLQFPNIAVVGVILWMTAMAYIYFLVFLSRRSLIHVVWICTQGICWKNARRARWWPWADITIRFQGPSGYSLHAGRECLDLPANRAGQAIGRYAEIKSSQAFLLTALRQLCERRTVVFDSLSVEATGIRWAGRFWVWQEIDRVALNERALQLHLRDAMVVDIPYPAVTFPRVIVALANVLTHERLPQLAGFGEVPDNRYNA
jgi:hypothetical protein